ncbi:MAG: alpha/beta hydrolase, partial [Pseudomonadota bacterium]
FLPTVFFNDDPNDVCGQNKQLEASGGGASAGYTCLELFFGTNRALANGAPAPLDASNRYPADPDTFFKDERETFATPSKAFERKKSADENHAAYETYVTGRAFVTVPKRQPGDKVKPFEYRGFMGRNRTPTDDDRAEEFTFYQYELMNQNDFWSRARSVKDVSVSLAGSNDFTEWANDAGAVLVFVHGFNTSLSGAAYRTAQLTYDLEFAGVPLFFSWPANSSGNVLSYFNDMSEASASVGDLKLFLRDVKAQLTPTKYILVAHSHGNQVVLDALNELAAEDPFAKNMFDAIIFASPDVDAAEFQRIAERTGKLARSKTLYTSQNDRANWFRMTLTRLRIPVFGERLEPKPRAGYIADGAEPLIVAGVNTIDVTNACVGPYGSNLNDADDDDRLKHAKYADAYDLVEDMRRIIDGLSANSITAPHRRNTSMRAIPRVAEPKFWRFYKQASSNSNCG